jgi:dihydrofolate reductase
MRKITIIEHISLDGIIQSPGSADEDRSGNFQFGGWSTRFSDPSLGDIILNAHQEPFELLLGRGVYDIWAAYWPKQQSGFAATFNKVIKHVVTHRPESLTWGPAKAISADVVDELRALKLSDGPDLICWGSSSLTPILLANELADEITLITYPILLGTGKKFFAEGTPPCQLELVTCLQLPSGIMVKTFKAASPVQFEQ